MLVMQKHRNITIDFTNFDGIIVDVRIPLHLTSEELITELVRLYGYEKIQANLQLKSFKSLLNGNIISSGDTLIEANVKNGDILKVIK